MRPRWVLALAAAFVLVVWGTVPASATDPIGLGVGYVVDDAGVLSAAEKNAAETRLEDMADDTGLDLWVVYVDEFTNPASAEEWANATAAQNGLGPTQYLLAIAVEARQFYLSGDIAGPLTEDQLATIEQQGILPALRDSDWAGAAAGAAAGITAAAAGGSGAPPAPSGSGGGGIGTVITVVAVVAIIGVIVFFVVRSRRRGGTAVAGTPKESTEELGRRAAAALVQTDDALRTGEQELGFAAAQFPESATAAFAAAVATSRAELDRAFALRQQLDDEVPDTDEQIRAWHTEVLALCQAATTRLQEQAADFDDLRRLEQDAPAALERVRSARAAVEAELAPASERFGRLSTAYAASAVAPVADNVDQARHRLGFADEQLAAAAAALGRGASGDAAVAIRSAEDAVAQARTLTQAIGTLDEQLTAATGQIPALAAELERDIAAAAALPDPDGRLAASVAAARTAAGEVRGGASSDPLAALQRLQSADEELDALLQSARDAAARAEHARQVLGPALTQAQAQISGAEDFIAARRGAVGATARTRLAEARAALGQALQEQSVSPERALSSAQRASQLAGAAADSARSDVGTFGSSGGGGSDMGAMLGGLLIGSALSGGNRRGGGFGGGYGGTRRSGFGGGSRSRSGGGGFGGSSGGRSRRGGGRF